MKKLVIVESPTKARTIQQFLGNQYRVFSSFGHVRDLPKSKLGIETEQDFEPTYVIPTKARKTVTSLKKEAKAADDVILATDEDREGEAIAWHLMKALELSDAQRIVFHEITKSAIEEALQHPRKIDQHLVDAQQARRVLDRLVGYKLSPFLWKKVARRLSAGRVQSVAVRLVVEREREIRAFKPQEYWTISAMLQKLHNQFEATLIQKEGKAIDKLDIKNKEEADAILKELEGAIYKVIAVEEKETKRNPLAPFTTSTLQQTSSQKFGFSAKQTMTVAQQLYEMGYITYHRTDSLNLAASAIVAAEQLISKTYGSQFSQERRFKTKSRGAQEAHEAIRPSYPDRTPEQIKKLTPQQRKLYTLIWSRFIASQMTPAVFNSLRADISASQYTFRATGQTLKFEGFLKVYPMKFQEADLPQLKENEIVELQELLPTQHFTEPPARYNEASLIKALESFGIGRPSTYAPTLATVQERNYVEKNEQRRFQPTDIGEAVNDLLVEHFPKIVDIEFTADMEEDLDKIAEGKKEWVPVMKEFYEPFASNLEKKYEEVKKTNIAVEETDKTCPECSKALVIRLGRYGKFYACTGFPECKYTESLASENPKEQFVVLCPKCKEGNLVGKRTKRRKIFYGCDRYPKCDFALWDKPTGKVCKECNSLLVEKRKKEECSNKECPTNAK